MDLLRHGNRPIARRRAALGNDNSVPGRTQTATSGSSDAANPRVPVPKSRVLSLSPTFAGRDLMLWRLKSHIWELSYWESPSASSKFTLFPFRTHQPKTELKLELQPGMSALNSFKSKSRTANLQSLC